MTNAKVALQVVLSCSSWAAARVSGLVACPTSSCCPWSRSTVWRTLGCRRRSCRHCWWRWYSRDFRSPLAPECCCDAKKVSKKWQNEWWKNARDMKWTSDGRIQKRLDRRKKQICSIKLSTIVWPSSKTEQDERKYRPVEGASDHYAAVDDGELVVHVRRRVCFGRMGFWRVCRGGGWW